jgi:hypothetical protein
MSCIVIFLVSEIYGDGKGHLTIIGQDPFPPGNDSGRECQLKFGEEV